MQHDSILVAGMFGLPFVPRSWHGMFDENAVARCLSARYNTARIVEKYGFVVRRSRLDGAILPDPRHPSLT